MQTLHLLKQKQGFTLTELLITVAISGIVMAGMSLSFISQKKHATTQDQIVDMQQNGRAALQLMTSELRMAGYDLTSSGNFGITNIFFLNLAGGQSPPAAVIAPETQANSAITFTMDLNEDGTLNSNETYSYALYDYDQGGTDVASRDLSRTVGGGGRQLLSENIEALGLAYAYDANNDGELDKYDTTNDADVDPDTVIWAIDHDNDGNWDRLDTNSDGVINIKDAPAGTTNGIINATATGTAIDTDDIRMIRIWLLVKSNQSDPNFTDTKAYVVGRQVITPSGSANTQGYRFLLMETTVVCRNIGL